MGRKHQDTHERWRSFHSLFSLSRERKYLRCFLSAPSLHEPSEPLLKQRIPRIQVALSPSKKQSDGLLFTWRRERDSNSRNRCRLDGFQDRSLQPLGHLSVCCSSWQSVFMYWFKTVPYRFAGLRSFAVLAFLQVNLQKPSFGFTNHSGTSPYIYWLNLSIITDIAALVERLTGDYCHIHSISARCAKSRNCRLQCCPGCHNIIDH